MSVTGWTSLAGCLAAVSVVLVAAPDRRVGRDVGRPGQDVVGRPAWWPTSMMVFDPAVAAAATVRRRLGRREDAGLDRRLAGAVAAGLGVGLVSPAAGVGAGVALWAVLSGRSRSTARRREQQLVDEVPDLVELFRLAVRAGLTVHLAVAAVSACSRGVGAADLAHVPARTARGERLADALEWWADCGEPLRPLASALAAAERYGDPLGPVLDRVAAEARLVRRRRAEESARRLPVQLLFPLVVCVLPAFVLLAVAPLLLAAVPQLPH